MGITASQILFFKKILSEDLWTWASWVWQMFGGTWQ